MNQSSKTLLFFQLLLTMCSLTKCVYYFGNANRETPIFIFHGLGTSCEDINKFWKPALMANENFTNVFCVESGENNDSILKNMEEQVQKGADYITSIYNDNRYTALMDNGIFLVGLSQGGIIARLTFNNFPMISERVRRLITLGSPQSGLDELPDVSGNKTVDNMLGYLLSTKLGNYVSSVGFFTGHSDKDIATGNYSLDHPFYSLNCNLKSEEKLRLLDTVVGKDLEPEAKEKLRVFLTNCVRIKKEYSHLEMMVNVAYYKDKTITPANSAIFRAGMMEISSDVALKSIKTQMKSYAEKIENLKTQRNKLKQSKELLEDQVKFPNKHINQIILKNMDTKSNTANHANSVERQKMIVENYKNSIKNNPKQIQSIKLQMNQLKDLISSDSHEYSLLSGDNESFQNILGHNLNENKFFIPNSIRETLAYKNNAISYRDLYDSNRMMNCVINGGHLEMHQFMIDQLVIRLLGLETPRIRQEDGQYEIPQGVPFIKPEKVSLLRLYCDFGGLVYPKSRYRILI